MECFRQEKGVIETPPVNSQGCQNSCFVAPACESEEKLKPYSTGANEPPAALSLLESIPAVSLYSSSSAEDFLVEVNLAEGAGIDIVAGAASSTGTKSVYGGPNPDFKRMSAKEALQAERKAYPDTVAVLNAEYFADLPRNSVPVAFPFKKDGLVKSEGFAAMQKHAGKRLSLVISKNYARVETFDNFDINKFKQIKEEDVLVSLSPSVNIDGRAAARIPRSYVGLAGNETDGRFSKLLFFVSSASTQGHAESTLKAHGAGAVIMLDGGGSSQLRWKERDLVKTTRGVPNFLAIIPGAVQSPADRVCRK